MNICGKFGRLMSGLLIVVLLCLSLPSVSNASGVNSNSQITLPKKMCVLGATLWPVTDTQIFDKDKNEIGYITAGTPIKAISVDDEFFTIYYNHKICLIDCNSVMIDLTCVMPKEMLYNITNSYSSIYKINGEDITEVTGEVLYPYVQIDAVTYLVPLLYPVAKHLYEAEKEALSKGYTLKVYDAYRPYEVTKYIYEKTSGFLEDNPDLNEYVDAEVGGVKYGQSFFLAKSASNHNYGVAVDITICDLETKQELTMQSDMHELSVNSILPLNTDAANILQEIMTNNGFGTLVSEWWHFEIRDYRSSVATFQARPYNS